MGLIALLLSLAGAAIHYRLTDQHPPGRALELVLVYMLAGYCGVAQIYNAGDLLLRPDVVATHVGVPTGNPITIWTGFLYLGAAVTGTLAIWLRGTYLVAPTFLWSIFFAGATYAHLHTCELNGLPITPVIIALIFASHGLISIILLSTWYLHWKSTRSDRLAVKSAGQA